MNPLQIRLAALRRRMVLVNLWRGSCTLFAVIVSILLIEGMADWKLHLPAPLRALFLVGTLVALGTVYIRYLYWPLTKRLDDLSLALRIEEIYPELNDNLASAVQFLDEPEENLAGSKIMRKHAIEHALKRADHCDFSNIIDRRGVFVRPVAAVVVGLLAVYFCCYHGAFTAKAETRLIDPFGPHFWTQIDVAEPPAHVAQGQTFIITGKLSGIIPERGRIEIDDASQPFDKTIFIERDDGAFQLPLDLSLDTAKFRFRIQANDGTYPAHGGWTNWILVKAPPRLEPMSPQIDLIYPAYTDLRSPKRLAPSFGQASVDAVAGTKIIWRAVVDRPIVNAWLEFSGGKLDGQLDSSRKIMTFEFTPPATTAVVTIHYKDDLGLANSEKLELNIFPDPIPTIQLRKPAWSVEKVLPTAQITLDLVVLDKVFAVRSVYLEYRRKSSNDWIDKEWRHVPILHSDLVGLFAMLGQSHEGLAGPMHVRPDLLELTAVWQLRGLFKEGDIVSFRVCADDFNDLVKPRGVGYSRVVDIVIVGEREFRQELDAEFEKAQKQIDLLQQAQEEANNNVKDVLENRKDGDPQKQRQKLIAAEQKQAAIKEIIGNPRDGLLKTMEDLKEKMAENKLPRSDLQDNVKALAKELERLNRVNLPQIEDNLANALRQIGRPDAKPETKPDAKPETKPDAKPETKPGAKPEARPEQKKDPLEQAKNFQDDTSKTLAELARFLDPWATQQQIKDRIIKLTAQQKDLKRDTEALSKKDRKAPPSKEELDPRAGRQNQLAEQADDLLKTIDKMLEKQQGTDAAEKLAAVAKIAEKARVPDKMRQVRDQLRQTPKLNDSVQKQGNIINDLEKMLAALDDPRREDKIEKLVKKQKNAQKDIEQFQNKMEQLDKKIKEANKIADPVQREQALKKLAPEQKALEEEARRLSRELARLQADKASRDLEHAADNMAKAAGKLGNGEDPGEIQPQVKKDLDKAKEDLQETEEELARERLALIADRLKGFKDREDAALAETERIHKALLKKNEWSRGLQESLKDSGVSQANLAQETEGIVEKLAQSPVFEYTLKKARGSMDGAAKAIAERKGRAVAGEPLDKDQLEAENKDQDKIVKLQKDASDRLDRLIAALKQDPPKKQTEKPKEEEPRKPDDKKKEEDPKQQKIRPSGDGIPPSAEIKELIKVQDEVRQQTKEFDVRCPDRNDLTEDQARELRALEDDQRRIGEMFQQLMNRGKKGEEQ